MRGEHKVRRSFIIISKRFISLDGKCDKICLCFLQRDFVHFSVSEKEKPKPLQIEGETHLDKELSWGRHYNFMKKFILVLITFTIRKVLFQFKLLACLPACLHLIFSVGFELVTLRSRSELRSGVGRLTDWAIQAPLSWFLFNSTSKQKHDHFYYFSWWLHWFLPPFLLLHFLFYLSLWFLKITSRDARVLCIGDSL